mgnify:CR=1 FL=1
MKKLAKILVVLGLGYTIYRLAEAVVDELTGEFEEEPNSDKPIPSKKKK